MGRRVLGHRCGSYLRRVIEPEFNQTRGLGTFLLLTFLLFDVCLLRTKSVLVRLAGLDHLSRELVELVCIFFDEVSASYLVL